MITRRIRIASLLSAHHLPVCFGAHHYCALPYINPILPPSPIHMLPVSPSRSALLSYIRINCKRAPVINPPKLRSRWNVTSRIPRLVVVEITSAGYGNSLKQTRLLGLVLIECDANVRMCHHAMGWDGLDFGGLRMSPCENEDGFSCERYRIQR